MDRRSLLKGIGGGAALSAVSPRAWGETRPGRWSRLETANFVIYSGAAEDKLVAEAGALEAYHNLLATLMPRKERSALKLPVYMSGTERDYVATAPNFKNSSVEGFYHAGIEEVRAVTGFGRYATRQRDMPRNVRADDARVVLFHEYAHHFIQANSRVSYPAWYQEGFAEFLSTVEFKDKGADLGKFTMNRAMWLSQGDWLPIEPFLTKNPFELSGDETAQFYAQSWLAAHYLFITPERARGFDRYIRELESGTDMLGAVQPAFGISVQDLDKELRAYRKKPTQFFTMPSIKVNASGLKAEKLGASADDLLMPVGYLRSLPSKAEASDTVNAVRTQARKYPDDAYTLQSLAFAEVWYGDLEEARKHVDALLKISAEAAETQHLQGLYDLRAAHIDEDEKLYKRAKGAFGRAYNLDNTRASSLFRYVESGLGATGDLDENLMDALVAAYRLAPQVSSISMTTASALMQKERYEEATLLLRPLAADPHGGGLVDLAKDLLASAKAEEETNMIFVGSFSIEGD